MKDTTDKVNHMKSISELSSKSTPARPCSQLSGIAMQVWPVDKSGIEAMVPLMWWWLCVALLAMYE